MKAREYYEQEGPAPEFTPGPKVQARVKRIMEQKTFGAYTVLRLVGFRFSGNRAYRHPVFEVLCNKCGRLNQVSGQHLTDTSQCKPCALVASKVARAAWNGSFKGRRGTPGWTAEDEQQQQQAPQQSPQ